MSECVGVWVCEVSGYVWVRLGRQAGDHVCKRLYGRGGY